jgi:nucleoside-diphosphate-sugar epimerase
MAGKKILITGGAGFIGYYIAKELLSLNAEVIIYDAFLNYISPPESRYASYLEYRLNNIRNKARVIRGDVRDKKYLMRVFKDVKPEVVIHLAAIPIAKVSNEFSEEAIQINLNGTITILECIRSVSNVRRFVFASSSFIYGDFRYEPADENHPANPVDIYGATKLSGEILIKSLGREHGIEYAVVRPSAVYGPTDANRRVSQILIENAILRKPLILHNKGLDRIDFTYVKDTAHGFVLAALSENAKNETFNITRQEGKSVGEFVDILKDIFPDLTIEERPSDIRRPKRGTLDTTKAKKLLGYKPKHDLRSGVGEYVNFILDNGFLKRDKI